MKIGIVATSISTIDYEGLVSLVIYTQGCNFRCPFCYSGELAKGESEIEITLEEALKEMDLKWHYIKGKGVFYIRKGKKKCEKLFYKNQLSLIFGNKLTRKLWSKRLEYLLK